MAEGGGARYGFAPGGDAILCPCGKPPIECELHALCMECCTVELMSDTLSGGRKPFRIAWESLGDSVV